MIATVAEHILTLPAWVALLVVFALPALESSAFVGFIFPGEIALILGGVMAYEGRVPLAAVLAAGIAGAAVGDSIGYAVGKRYGRGLLDGTVGRFVKADHLDRAEAYLAERGGKAVFFGRFTAALRVLIPGLAGMSGLRYRTFLTFNLASAVGWATLSVMLGYLGGSSWRHVEHIASRIGLGALAVVALAVLAGVLVRRGGPDKVARLANATSASAPVRRVRHRFPRTTAWVLGRLDPTRSTGLALTATVAVAAAAAWTFAGITQDVVAHEELALLDPRVHTWVLGHRTGPLTGFFRVVTWLGASVVTIPLLAGVGGTLARRRPSGHTTQAVAAWGILALLLAEHARPRNWVLLVTAAAGIAALVGASRIYLGVHWASDVAGGAVLSVAVLALWGILRHSHFASRSVEESTRAEHQDVST